MVWMDFVRKEQFLRYVDFFLLFRFLKRFLAADILSWWWVSFQCTLASCITILSQNPFTSSLTDGWIWTIQTKSTRELNIYLLTTHIFSAHLTSCVGLIVKIGSDTYPRSNIYNNIEVFEQRHCFMFSFDWSILC